MSFGITVVTTTHDRPLCLSLLLRWVALQITQPGQHVIVSDGTDKPVYHAHEGTARDLTWRVAGAHRVAVSGVAELHHRKPKKDEPFSLKANWLYAIPKIRHDRILVLEDDDWYHPDFIFEMDRALDRAELVGVAGDYYWNWTHRKYTRMHNGKTASLAATAFRASLLPSFQQIVEWSEDVWIDKRLWTETTAKTELIPNVAADGRALHVGMKGMPGAAGLGAYHGDEGVSDPAAEQLTQWIGLQDSLRYQRLPRPV